MKVARTTPTSLAYDTPFATFEEADSARSHYEVVNELGGLVVVKFEERFYVVYGGDYFNGFTDFYETDVDTVP